MKKYDVWNIDNLPEDFDGSVCEFIANNDNYDSELFDKIYDACTAEVGSKWRDDELIVEINEILDEIVGVGDHQASDDGKYPEWMCNDDVYNHVLETLDSEDGYGKYRLACFLAETNEEERRRSEDYDRDDYEPDYGWYAGVTIGDRGLEY